MIAVKYNFIFYNYYLSSKKINKISNAVLVQNIILYKNILLIIIFLINF